MLIIAHRINTIEGLKTIPKKYGVEIDVRCMGDRLILNHEPHKEGDDLEEYLKHYHHRFIIFNIKEAGIEEEVINLAKKYNIKDYFLLDVEYPFIYRATRKMDFSKIAIRYSEAEPIEFTLAHKKMVEWVWIDTNSVLPLDKDVVRQLKPFKTCLVCPERWGRPGDIQKYIKKMRLLNFKLDAVMTALKYAKEWESYGK
jgi:hypothetical protein